jgi:hypothetical protein
LVLELCGESSAPEEGVDDVDVEIVPLRGAPGRLILAGMPWVTSRFPSILIGYNMEGLSEMDYLVLYTKLCSCLWAHMSGQAGSTERSAGLLLGRARVSGTTETLVGRNPWVPMCLKARNKEGGEKGKKRKVKDESDKNVRAKDNEKICNLMRSKVRRRRRIN